MKEVLLYTDGACKYNPGPGGWGCVLIYKGKEKETLSLIFDQGGMDRVIYIDSNNQEQVLDFAANQKLSKKIDDTIAYFNGSRPAPYFHDGMTSFKFHILLEQMGQTAPMAKSALMERILSTNTQHTR